MIEWIRNIILSTDIQHNSMLLCQTVGSEAFFKYPQYLSRKIVLSDCEG